GRPVGGERAAARELSSRSGQSACWRGRCGRCAMIRTTRPLGFLAVGIVAAVVACAAPPPSGVSPSAEVEIQRSALKTAVTVTVLDTSGVAQTGATVYADHTNGTVVTSGLVDANGHAVISLAAGTYQFAVPGSPSGFLYLSSTCSVPSCTTASITVQKPVQITVVDGFGNPAA